MNVDIIALIIKYNVEYRTGLFVKIIFLLNNLTRTYIRLNTKKGSIILTGIILFQKRMG